MATTRPSHTPALLLAPPAMSTAVNQNQTKAIPRIIQERFLMTVSDLRLDKGLTIPYLDLASKLTAFERIASLHEKMGTNSDVNCKLIRAERLKLQNRIYYYYKGNEIDFSGLTHDETERRRHLIGFLKVVEQEIALEAKIKNSGILRPYGGKNSFPLFGEDKPDISYYFGKSKLLNEGICELLCLIRSIKQDSRIDPQEEKVQNLGFLGAIERCLESYPGIYKKESNEYKLISTNFKNFYDQYQNTYYSELKKTRSARKRKAAILTQDEDNEKKNFSQTQTFQLQTAQSNGEKAKDQLLNKYEQELKTLLDKLTEKNTANDKQSQLMAKVSQAELALTQAKNSQEQLAKQHQQELKALENRLSAEIERLQQEINDKQNEINAKQHEINLAALRLQAQQSDIEKQDQKLKQQAQELNEQRKQHSLQEQDFDGKQSQLTTRLSKLQAEYVLAQTQAKNSQEQLAKQHQQELKSLENRLSEEIERLQQEINDKQNELNDKQLKINSVVLRLQAQESQIQEQRDKLSRQQSEFEQQKNRIFAQHAAALESLQNAANLKQKELHDKHATSLATIQQLQHSQLQQLAQLQQSQIQNEKLIEERVKRRLTDELHRANQKLNEKDLHAKAVEEKLQQRIRELETKERELTDKNRKLEQKLESLQNAADEEKRQYDAIANEVSMSLIGNLNSSTTPSSLSRASSSIPLEDEDDAILTLTTTTSSSSSSICLPPPPTHSTLPTAASLISTSNSVVVAEQRNPLPTSTLAFPSNPLMLPLSVLQDCNKQDTKKASEEFRQKSAPLNDAEKQKTMGQKNVLTANQGIADKKSIQEQHSRRLTDKLYDEIQQLTKENIRLKDAIAIVQGNQLSNLPQDYFKNDESMEAEPVLSNTNVSLPSSQFSTTSTSSGFPYSSSSSSYSPTLFATSTVSLKVPTNSVKNSIFHSKQKLDLKKKSTIVDDLLLARVKEQHFVHNNFFRNRKYIIDLKTQLKTLNIQIQKIDTNHSVFLKGDEKIESVSYGDLRRNMKSALDIALNCFTESDKYKYCYFNTTPKKRTDGWYEVHHSRLTSEKKALINLSGKGFKVHIDHQFNDAKNILNECKAHMKIICYDSKTNHFKKFDIDINKDSYPDVVSLIFDRKEDAEEWCKAHGGDWLPPPDPAATSTAAAGATTTTSSTAGIFSTSNSSNIFADALMDAESHALELDNTR